MSQYDYTVIEDNGGGLHLFVFHPGSDVPVLSFTGFEHDNDSLLDSIDGLDSGDDPAGWDGAEDDPAESWNYIQQHESGFEVIAWSENGERKIQPQKMGRAGQIAFGIESE